MKRIHELSQAEYESLPPDEYAAVTSLLFDELAGRVHAGSSLFDLFPHQLVEELVQVEVAGH